MKIIKSLQSLINQIRLRTLKVSFSLRLFLFFFLLIGIGLSIQLMVLLEEMRPGVRQGTEEILVDSANLLAEIAAPALIAGTLDRDFHQAFQRFKLREINAKIWSKQKNHSKLNAYITDNKGIVLYNSTGDDIGESYAQWNDVRLTLDGKYGARSSPDPQTPLATIMYVAAPIKVKNQLVGVLTLSKPNVSLEPFLVQSKTNAIRYGSIIIIASILLGLFVSYWLTRSIRRLNNYATKVSDGAEAPLPKFIDLELNNLALAMAKMKLQLEGKNYVEHYVHSLTHELKSPIAAIKGATELLEMPMEETNRLRFINNIKVENKRLEDIVNQLLKLASLENQKKLDNIESVAVATLIADIIQSLKLQANQKQLRFYVEGNISVEADLFLLRQAITNLLTNAIDFSPENGIIKVVSSYQDDTAIINVTDEGGGIPEFALSKVFNRFYSLPRPDTNKKSSGLGLSFVQQICILHKGKCVIENTDIGASATLILPKI